MFCPRNIIVFVLAVWTAGLQAACPANVKHCYLCTAAQNGSDLCGGSPLITTGSLTYDAIPGPYLFGVTSTSVSGFGASYFTLPADCQAFLTSTAKDNYSIEYQINTVATGTFQSFIYNNANPSWDYQGLNEPSTGYVNTMRLGSIGGITHSNSPIALGAWTGLAWDWDGLTYTFYNGNVADGSNTNLSTWQNGPIVVGKYVSGTYLYPLTGSISRIVILDASSSIHPSALGYTSTSTVTPDPALPLSQSPTQTSSPTATPSSTPVAGSTPTPGSVCSSYGSSVIAFYGGNSDGQLHDAVGSHDLIPTGTVPNSGSGQPEGDHWLGTFFSGSGTQAWLGIPSAAWPGTSGALEMKFKFVAGGPNNLFLVSKGADFVSVNFTSVHFGLDCVKSSTLVAAPYGNPNLVAGQTYTTRLEWGGFGMRVLVNGVVYASTAVTMGWSSVDSVIIGAYPGAAFRDLVSPVDALAVLSDPVGTVCNSWSSGPVSPSPSYTADLSSPTCSPSSSPTPTSTATATPYSTCSGYGPDVIAFYGGNSGQRLYDSTGHGFDLVGNSALVPNPAGGTEGDRWLGSGFTGTNYIQAPAAAWPGQTQGAMEMKLLYATPAFTQEQLFYVNRGDFTQYFSLYINSGGQIGVDYVSGSPAAFVGAHGMVPGQVYTIRLEWNSGGVKVRVNGTVVASATGPVTLAVNTDLGFGAYPAFAGRNLQSKIDAVAFLSDPAGIVCTGPPTPSPTFSSSATLTESSTPTPTTSPTATTTDTGTATTTASATPSVTASNTPTFTSTSTETPSSSATPTGTATMTDVLSPTFSPTQTATASASPTPTSTQTSTVSATPTSTATVTDLLTPTFSPTQTCTPSGSPTPTATRTATGSATETPTRTVTPSGTPTPTRTATPLSAMGLTVIFTHSLTPSPSLTSTATPTPASSSPLASPTNTPIVPKMSDQDQLLVLRGVYPVPSDGPVTLYFTLREAAQLTFGVYNVAGEKVWDIQVPAGAGVQTLVWPSSNSSGERAASGIYLLRLLASSNAGEQDSAWGTAALKR